jgi:hypothetical protein
MAAFVPDWSREDEVFLHRRTVDDTYGYVRGCGHDDDDDDATAARAKEQAALFSQAVELIKACRRHIRTPETARVARGSEQREALEPLWLRHFLAISVAEKGNMQLARSDVCFIALCWSRMAERPQLLGEVCWQWVALTFVEIVNISCQHTSDSRAYWPAPESWAELLEMVSAVVAVYVEGASQKRQMLLKQCEASKDGREARLQFEQLPVDLIERYTSRQEPPSLLAHLENTRRKAAAERAKGESDVREEVSEEARGAIWRNTAPELLANYVRMASRLYRSVTLHNAMVARYEKDPPYNLTPMALNQAFHWLYNKCRVDQPDEVRAHFRDLANEWFYPLGAETERYRDKRTRDDLEQPLTVLNTEIGMDLSQHLQECTLKKLVDIGSNQDALHWDALFLTLLDNVFKQRVQIHWRREYVFTTEQEVHSPALRKRMESEHYQGVTNKRPLILKLQRRFWLFEGKRLRACHNLCHAVLSWMHRVRSGFIGVLECTTDVRAVIDSVLHKNPVV